MSQLLDRDVVHHQALVVDANPLSRSVMVQHLRSFGFEQVKQASRTLDARDMLEHRRYHLVVCDAHFESDGSSGQELLEELRREQMLPYSTVFVMVTGEATYAKVAEAAEVALDSYLVKPFSANSLFERIKEARQRKRVLKDIFEAIEARQLEAAARLCVARFEQRELYWLYAARIGAELLLTLRRPEQARSLYDAVNAGRTAPWARLGVARAQLAEGDVLQARRSVEGLVAELPQFADSYDVLGRVQMEQGQLKDALDTYRTAATLTPGCILRLQHCGTLAFYCGDSATATGMLERTWALGHKSRLFDVLSMMLLAFLRFDARDGKGLAVAHEVLERFSSTHSQSVRLRRMTQTCQVMLDLNQGRVGPAMDRARATLGELTRPDFDMEAATNTLALWTRLLPHGIAAGEHENLVRTLARRFSVSKAATEVLCAAVQHQTNPQRWVRDAHSEVLQLAEQAMNHALGGQARTAVESLLHHGKSTGNAKLIEMAGAVAQRHRERIDGVDQLLESAGSLSHRYCSPLTHIAGVRRSNRSAGGLVLRR